MFSCTLKRSAATLGVVAGLLAAAGPASAQILDGPVLAKAGSGEGVKAPVPASCLVDFQPGVCYFHTVKAPANAMSAGISGKEMTDAVKAPTSSTPGVFTSVSNVAPLHGDATTTWAWHEAARNGLAHVEVGMGMSEDFLKAPQIDVASGNDTVAAAERVWGPIVYVGSAGVKAPTPTAGTQVGSEGVKAQTNAGTQIGFED